MSFIIINGYEISWSEWLNRFQHSVKIYKIDPITDYSTRLEF